MTSAAAVPTTGNTSARADDIDECAVDYEESVHGGSDAGGEVDMASPPCERLRSRSPSPEVTTADTERGRYRSRSPISPTSESPATQKARLAREALGYSPSPPLGQGGTSSPLFSPSSVEEGEESESPPQQSREVTNLTEEDEERLRIRSAPEHRPWLPPARLLNAWNMRRSPKYSVPLFDISQIVNDRGYMERAYPRYSEGKARRNFYVALFFRSRMVSGRHQHRSFESADVDALIQAWEAFITNINRRGIDVWMQRLQTLQLSYEQHSRFGARMRVHRLSREAGLPCFVRPEEGCPMCPSGAEHAPPDAHDLNNMKWSKRIPYDLRDAMARLADLGGAAVAESDAPRQRGAGLRTIVRGPERQRRARREVPTYRQRADSHAIERESPFSFESTPADPYDSAGAQPASNDSPRGQPAAGAVEERRGLPSDRTSVVDIPPACQQSALGESVAGLRRDLDAERAARLSSEVTQANLRADLAQFRADFQQQRHETQLLRTEFDRLLRDYRSLLGELHQQGIGRVKRRRTDNTDEGGQHKK